MAGPIVILGIFACVIAWMIFGTGGLIAVACIIAWLAYEMRRAGK